MQVFEDKNCYRIESVGGLYTKFSAKDYIIYKSSTTDFFDNPWELLEGLGY